MVDIGKKFSGNRRPVIIDGEVSSFLVEERPYCFGFSRKSIDFRKLHFNSRNT